MNINLTALVLALIVLALGLFYVFFSYMAAVVEVAVFILEVCSLERN